MTRTPTHSHLAQTLEWITRVRPLNALLTNMHTDLGHATVEQETPKHVSGAFDGMLLDFNLD